MEENIVNITINGEPIMAKRYEKVLEVARRAGYDIPTLCFLKGINETANCRMCVVEADINGRPMRGLPASCALEVAEGMNIRTNTKRVREAVKMNLELILANHNRECVSCARSGNCELQNLCEKMGVEQIRFKGEHRPVTIDNFSPSIVRDTSKCILCGRCVSTCQKIQSMGVLAYTKRGFKSEIGPAYEYSLNEVDCLLCGQCVEACPVAALKEKDDIDAVLEALENKDQHVVVQVAPAVRAALGECFGLPIGTDVTGELYTALHRLGFARVFDTTFAADLTIMEEATELINRITTKGPLPLITSCSPGWIRFAEFKHPELLKNISSCKSPQQMMGAVIKSYYADKMQLDPKKIVSVSIMPCTAKKAEARRSEMKNDLGLADVDYVLTTRELGRLIKRAGMNLLALPKGKPDPLLSEYSGAGVIFGATGGVMEAALRTAADILTGQDLQAIEYQDCRDLQGVKEGSVTIDMKGQPLTINYAIAHSISKAEELLKRVQNKEKNYHFIEIMACPGGCVNGGGQPIVSSIKRDEINPAELRAKVLYQQDKNMAHRKSHENEEVKALYRDYLGAPNSELAHILLHTHYAKKTRYPLKNKD